MALRAEDLHRFSVDQYLGWADTDPAAPDHTELVDGVIFSVSPESLLHADAGYRTVELPGGYRDLDVARHLAAPS